MFVDRTFSCYSREISLFARIAKLDCWCSGTIMSNCAKDNATAAFYWQVLCCTSGLLDFPGERISSRPAGLFHDNEVSVLTIDAQDGPWLMSLVNITPWLKQCYWTRLINNFTGEAMPFAIHFSSATENHPHLQTGFCKLARVHCRVASTFLFFVCDSLTGYPVQQMTPHKLQHWWFTSHPVSTISEKSETPGEPFERDVWWKCYTGQLYTVSESYK